MKLLIHLADLWIQSDEIYPEGDLTIKDILSILPFEDIIIVIKASGMSLITFERIRNREREKILFS
jgi:2',3'-cyclic-nucleotide 2'-phosphodiesterase (5'-nucleotidase family)